jgi:hypothetical protein
MTSGAGILGVVIDKSVPLAVVCTGLVVADCVSAWMLSRRVARRVARAAPDAGKFSSRKVARVFRTLARVYGLLLAATAVDVVILKSESFEVSRFAAGAVCFWQALSILENEASLNDSPWAKVARRYLIDKAARHIGVPADPLDRDISK